MTFAQLARRVRDRIAQDHRYAHTVRVARCADLLAQAHDLDRNKARLAGMLHDLARLYSGPRLIEETQARGLPVGDFERANPIVLHARLSAEIARESFGVDDPEILSAIAKHTTADAEMSALDCALYLADGLEPGRDFPERAGLWAFARRDLRAATGALLAHTFGYLSQRKIPIAPQTAGAARAFGLHLEEVGISAN